MLLARAELLRTLGSATTAEESEHLCLRLEEAWPDFVVDAAEFGRTLLAAWRRTDRSVPAHKLAVTDLYLALACLKHDPSALQVLDRRLRDVALLLRSQANESQLEEAIQRSRERLLISAHGKAPKLALYNGRGPLSAFVRIVVLNVLRNLISTEGPQRNHREPGERDGHIASSLDVERRFGAIDQQVKFKEAFRAAVRALPLRDRTLLRLSVLEGLSIDELAPLYKVSRATVARWLSSARDALALTTKEHLQEYLKLDEVEAQRLLESVKTGFELSLSDVFRDSLNTRPGPK